MTDYFETLCTMIARHFGVDREEMDVSTTLAELDLDSLALVELGYAVGEELGASDAEQAISGESSLGEVALMIETANGGQSG